MSRGPGKVERAIIDMLTASPAGTFTVEDFASVVYPGVNRIEKKHRVAILRAIRNIKNPPGTWWMFKSANHAKGFYVLHNRLSLRSYGVAIERTERSVDAHISDTQAERNALREGSKTYPYLLEDGPYPILIEYFRACMEGDEDQKNMLWAIYEKGVKTIVYARGKKFTGNIHPDFLRDCVTLDKKRQEGELESSQ